MADDDAGAHRATLRVELFAVIAPSSTGTPATVTTLRYRLGGLRQVAGAPVDVVAGGSGAFSVVAAAPPPQPGRPPPQPVAATGPTVAPPPPPLLLRHQSAAFTVLVDTACAVRLARDPLLSLHVGLNPAAPAVLAAGKGGAKAPPTSGKAGPPPCSATTAARNDFAAMLPVDCSALLGNASSVVWSCGDAHAAAAAAAAAVPPLPAVATAATSSAPPAGALAPLEAALGLAAGALARTASPLPAPPGLAWLAVCVHVQSAAAPVAAAAPPPAQAPVPGGGATKRAAAPVATAGAAAGRKSGATAGSDVPPGFAPVQPPVLLSPRLLLRLCPLRVSLRSVCGLPSAPAPSTDGCSSSSSSSSSILPQPFMVLRLTSLSPAPLLPPGTCPTESVLLPSVGGAAHTPPSTADCGEDALVEPAVVLPMPPPTPLDGGSTLTLGVTSVVCLGLLLPRPPAGAVDGAAAASQDDGPGRAAALLRELLETRTLTLELHHNHTQWAAEGCTGHVEAGAGGGSSATAAARGPWYALPPWRVPHYQAVACGSAAPSSQQLQSLADATPPSDAGSASTAKQNKDAAAAAAAVVPPASAVSVRVAPAASGSAATPPGGVAAAAALLDAADRLATSELTARALSAGERHPHAIACVRLAPLVAVLDADAAAAALPWAVAPSGTSARAVAPRACVELVGQFVPASRRTRPPRPQSPQAPPPLPQQQPQPALQELAHSPCVGASHATAPSALIRREALLVLDTAAAAAAEGVARSSPPPPTPPAPDRPALLQLAAPLDYRAARVKLCVELLAPPAAVGRAATPGSQQRGGDSLLPPLAADGASLARGGVAHDATAAAAADGTAAGGGSVAEELPRPLLPPPASLLSLSARGASLAGGPPNSLSLSDPPMMSAARPPPAAADQPAGGGRGATSTARAARRARRGRRHSKLSVREIMATRSSSSSRGGGRAVGAAAARRAARGSSCVDHVRSHREFVARLSASASRARAAAAPRVLDAATGVDVTPPGCATLSQLRDALLAAAADGEFTYSFAPAAGSNAAALEPYAPPPGDALLLRPASNPAKWPGRRGFVLSGAAAPSCAEAVAAAQPPLPPPPLPETVCHPPLPPTALAPWGAPLFDATVDPRPLRGGVFGAVQPHALTRAAATRPVQCDVTAAQAAADAAARVAAARAQWRAKLVVRDPVLRVATRAGGDATQAARRRSLLADAPAKAALRHAHRIYGSAAPAREGEEGEREGAASGDGADDDRRDAAAAPLSIFAPGDGRAAAAPPGRL